MHGMVRSPGDMPAAFARALEDGDLEQFASLYADEAATRHLGPGRPRQGTNP